MKRFNEVNEFDTHYRWYCNAVGKKYNSAQSDIWEEMTREYDQRQVRAIFRGFARDYNGKSRPKELGDLIEALIAKKRSLCDGFMENEVQQARDWDEIKCEDSQKMVDLAAAYLRRTPENKQEIMDTYNKTFPKVFNLAKKVKCVSIKVADRDVVFALAELEEFATDPRTMVLEAVYLLGLPKGPEREEWIAMSGHSEQKLIEIHESRFCMNNRASKSMYMRK